MIRRLLVASALIAACPAQANDSIAEIGTGGLVLGRSNDVFMDSEDLFVSPDRVTVDYVFHNRSEADVDTVVAFPMPDIEANPYGMVAIPAAEDDNFLGFEVEIDGAPVAPNLEQRVVAAGIDVTGELAARKVPLNPFAPGVEAALAALPDDVAADWIARGILVVEEFDDGSGWKRVRSPYWRLRSTYWWRATFPAGKPVRVSHAYTPSLGASVGINFFEGGKAQGETFDLYRTKYCMDDGFVRAVEKSARTNPSGFPTLSESRLSYVLTTGGNWALGSIGRFKLTVDKGDAKNIVSFCGQGVKKTGPTTFEMTAEEFYPTRDVDVLILTPQTPAGPQPAGNGG